MKRLLNLVFTIFIFISIGCSSEQTVTKDNETAIKDVSVNEKKKRNDFDVNTYKAEFEGIELQIPSSWTNENPYFYAEGAKDRTFVTMLYVFQETDSKYKEYDIKQIAPGFFDQIESRLENDDFKTSDLKYVTINGINMANKGYENAKLSNVLLSFETYVFVGDDSLIAISLNQSDKSLYDHFDDFEKVIHSIKKNDKTEITDNSATNETVIKKSTDFADAQKYTTVKLENYEIDFPEKWIREDRFFYPTDNDNSASIGYFVMDQGGFTESWLDQAADILFDEMATGMKWSENEKVNVNGIRMQKIVASSNAEGGIKITEYLFVNPATTNAIGILINEPSNQDVDYMNDFESIVHSIRQVEPGESIATQESDKHEEIIEEEIPEEEVIPFNPIDDISWQGRTDYAHFSDSVAILGNNEKLYMEIEASPAGLKEDDFYLKYDKALLSCTVDSITSDEKEGKTILKLTVAAKKPGYSTFEIDSSYYRILVDDEEEFWISVPVTGLDSREGRIVYITPSGEKYHFSKECAGENYVETTLYDVESMEIKPCGKCAK